MADDQPLSPLDDAFVASLIQRVGVDDHLLGAAAQRHWKAVIARFPVAQYIAQRFGRGDWVGDEDWFVDPGIQEVFRGYDWTRYEGQDRPMGRQTVQNYPPTPVPNPPQSRTIPTGSQAAQNTPPTQTSNTRGQASQTGQTSQAGRQRVQNIPSTQAPTPPSQNIQRGRRNIQNIPTTQVTSASRGQSSQTGRQNVQNVPSGQASNTPRTQGRTRFGAGRLTPGPDVADVSRT